MSINTESEFKYRLKQAKDLAKELRYLYNKFEDKPTHCVVEELSIDYDIYFQYENGVEYCIKDNNSWIINFDARTTRTLYKENYKFIVYFGQIVLNHELGPDNKIIRPERESIQFKEIMIFVGNLIMPGYFMRSKFDYFNKDIKKLSQYLELPELAVACRLYALDIIDEL